MFATLDLIPSGRFYSRPAMVDSTDDEIVALINQQLPEERVTLLGCALRLAAQYLAKVEAAGRC